MTNYTYDANGNMIGDGRFYYEYDALNQLVRVRSGGQAGAIVEEYSYNHAGKRTKKVEVEASGNTTTYYVSDLFEVTVYPDGTRVNTSTTMRMASESPGR